MSKGHKKVREPLFHIVKRDALPWKKAWLIRFAAIVLALVFCGIVTLLLTNLNPLEIYKSMFGGAFRTPRRIGSLFQDIAMLLCVAIAVTPAFKMRFWNIGAEGQVLVGALASTACAVFLGGKISNSQLILLMFVASVVAGAIWAYIPALFKAEWNTNETLFTLMMNYIATQIVAYFTLIWSSSKGSGDMGIIPYGHLPIIIDEDYHILNIIIVAIITVFMFIYLKYSKHGYEISVVGGSENTARYVGINVKKVIKRTMLLSGAICGIAGFLLFAGTNHSLKPDTAGGRGFTAIMVSWLAKFNPIFMVFTSFLLVFLGKGASEISERNNLNSSFSDIITGIIIFFIIGSEFFINYKIKFNSRTEEELR